MLDADDREALVEQVRRLLADHCTQADVRRITDSPTGHDPALWERLVALGLPGLTVPEARGGAGLGPIELGLVMEEAGAALLPAPLLSSAVAAALADDEGQAAIAGGATVAVAFAGAHDWTGRSDVRAEGEGLAGTARFVPDAAIAETILVALDDAVFAVARADADIAPLATFDRTRRLADVTFHGFARRIGDDSRVAYARDLACVALAGEMAGGARRMLGMTVDYARERFQFGRAIGSFQAIKHMAADLLLESESATSAARDAATQLAHDAPGKDAALALASFACADAFVRCCADGIQMHGGIAFTWDHPAHLYLRRARADALLLSDSDRWRDRYVSALEAAA